MRYCLIQKWSFLHCIPLGETTDSTTPTCRRWTTWTILTSSASYPPRSSRSTPLPTMKMKRTQSMHPASRASSSLSTLSSLFPALLVSCFCLLLCERKVVGECGLCVCELCKYLCLIFLFAGLMSESEDC